MKKIQRHRAAFSRGFSSDPGDRQPGAGFSVGSDAGSSTGDSLRSGARAPKDATWLHSAHGSAVFPAVSSVAAGAVAIYRGPSDLPAAGAGSGGGGLFLGGQPADTKVVEAGAGPPWTNGA